MDRLNVVLQFIRQPITAYIAYIHPGGCHAAVLAVMTMVTHNTEVIEDLWAPVTLFGGKHLVEGRNVQVGGRLLGIVPPIKAFTDRGPRPSAGYRIPVVVYKASALHSRILPPLVRSVR